MLFWNCTFIGTGAKNKFNIGQYESTTSPTNQFLLKNVSIVGCLFERFRSTVSQADKSWVNNADVELVGNHYITSSDSGDYHLMIPRTTGGANTMGDPKIVTSTSSSDFGRPQSGSPLLDRVSPPRIPADATGKRHGSAADIGALAK